MDEFGSFAGVLAGSDARLRRTGADGGVVAGIRLCRSAVRLSLKARFAERPILGTSSALMDYLHFELSEATAECFRALFLNATNGLIADEQIAEGTVDSAPFYPREIIGRALEIGATSLIVVHNHPSGDPTPSREDVDSTRGLAALCAGLGITLLDHVVIGRGRAVSLRKHGVLDQ